MLMADQYPKYHAIQEYRRSTAKGATFFFTVVTHERRAILCHEANVSMRISDVESWRASEQTSDSHDDACTFRRLVAVMKRLFKNDFVMPEECFPRLRADQAALFP